MVEWVAPALKRLLVKAVEQFAQLSEMELDLRLKLQEQASLPKNWQMILHKGTQNLFKTHNKCMLVMEWTDGVRIDDVVPFTQQATISSKSQKWPQPVFSTRFSEMVFFTAMLIRGIFS